MRKVVCHRNCRARLSTSPCLDLILHSKLLGLAAALRSAAHTMVRPEESLNPLSKPAKVVHDRSPYVSALKRVWCFLATNADFGFSCRKGPLVH